MKKRLTTGIIFLLFFCWLQFLQAKDNKQEIPNFIISEIFYYPLKKYEGKRYNSQWIEVYAEGEMKMEEIGGDEEEYIFDFRFCDRDEDSGKDCKESHPIYYDEDELKLDKGEIFIIARDKDLFEKKYKDYDGKILESKFNLSSSKNPNFVGIFKKGENEEGKEEAVWIDKVEYKKDWGGYKTGRSIEKKDLDGKDDKKNWAESVLLGGTPGEEYKKIEIDYPDNLVINELLPNPEGDESENEFIEIKNLLDEDADLSNWIIEEGSGNTYSLEQGAEIKKKDFLVIKGKDSGIRLNNSSDEEIKLLNPANKEVDKVSYKKAEEGISLSRNNKGNFAWTSIITPGKENEFPKPKEYSDKIIFNELLPSPKGSDRENEWIEIKNLSDEDVELGDWYIEDKGGARHTLGQDLEIAAKGILLIKRKESRISLNNGGDKLYLFNPNGKETDSISYEKAEEGFAWARNKEGKYRWTSLATPGKENEFPEPRDYSDDRVVINELLPNPSGSDSKNEWIELYNQGEKDVGLEGWFLMDESEKKFYFEKTKIKKKKFLLIKAKESRISLNNSGDKIFLFNPNGKKSDAVKYGKSPAEDFSFARRSKEKFLWTSILTPGKKNEFLEDIVFSSGVRINEIMSNPEGRDKNNEWIEFFNSSAEEIDLSGWILENSSDKTFTIENFKIAPRRHKVLHLEETSFYIKNSEEKLKFYNPRKEKIQEVDLTTKSSSGASFNRAPKGAWRWSRFITPGRENRLNISPKIKIKKDKNIYKGVKAEFDASKTTDADGDELKFRWDFGDGHRSYKDTIAHKYEEEGEFLVQLRVSDGSEEVFKKFIIEVEEYPRDEVEIVELMPNPIGKDSENEYIILKNNSNGRVNLQGWKIATGKDKDSLTNHPIYDNFIIKEGKEKKLDRDISKFALLNKKCLVVLKYPDGEIADQASYEKEKILENERYLLKDKNWIWLAPPAKADLKSAGAVLNLRSSRRSTAMAADFQKILLKAFYNDKTKMTQNLKQLKIENWQARNKAWLKYTGLILFLKKV